MQSVSHRLPQFGHWFDGQTQGSSPHSKQWSSPSSTSSQSQHEAQPSHAAQSEVPKTSEQ